jgi:hypothetical protein
VHRGRAGDLVTVELLRRPGVVVVASLPRGPRIGPITLRPPSSHETRAEAISDGEHRSQRFRKP